MKNLSKKLLGPVQVVILAILFSVGGSYLYAAVSGWSEPGCAAPGCNATAPLNISTDPQIKDGPLYVGNVPMQSGIGFQVVNGNVAIGNITPTNKLTVAGDIGATAFYYSSDRSLKTNITPLQDSLSKITELQGVSFNWKNGGAKSDGLIAQDVEKVYPELVNTDPKTGLKSLEYANLVAPLIEAIKTQQKEIDDLKVQIKALQK